MNYSRKSKLLTFMGSLLLILAISLGAAAAIRHTRQAQKGRTELLQDAESAKDRLLDPAAGAIAGLCGELLNWSFDPVTGELVISGAGDMFDYQVGFEAPWYSYRDGIQTITVRQGVTRIGVCAFYNCGNLTSVSLPDSLEELGNRAFRGCKSLEVVNLPRKLRKIGVHCFLRAECLEQINVSPENTTFSSQDGVLFSADGSVLVLFPQARRGTYTVPDGVTVIQNHAFSDCRFLTDITIPASVVSMDAAFSGECYLRSAVFLGDAPRGQNGFPWVADGFVLYRYESASGWTPGAWTRYPQIYLQTEAPFERM